MKKSYIIISLIVLMSLGIAVMIDMNPRLLTADSGWDNDYSSSSSGSSSSSDSSSSWSSSSSGGNKSGQTSVKDTIISFLVVAGIFVLLNTIAYVTYLIFSYIKAKIRHAIKKLKLKSNKKDMEDLINNYFPTYSNSILLISTLYKIFEDIQIAWMNFDYDKLKELCTDELYNSYKTDLEILKTKNNQNIMSNFKFYSYEIDNITEQNDKIIIDVRIYVSFKDYIINSNTRSIVRGNKYNTFYNIYKLEFIYDKNTINKCPNCGSQLTGRDCIYCNTHVETYNDCFVLSKKEKVDK